MEAIVNYETRFTARMPKSYLRENSPETIRLHAVLARRAAAGGVQIYSQPTGNPRVFSVAVCSKDRFGLFSRFAGAFTYHGMNILSARAYTLQNRMALDVFSVSLPLSVAFAVYDWEPVRRTMNESLTGRLDLPRAIEEKLRVLPPLANAPDIEPSISISKVRSRRATRIMVEATDEPGLLFRLSMCLIRCHVSIREAEIRTEGFRAKDSFLVRDMNNLAPVGEDRLEIIHRMMMRELTEPGWRSGISPPAGGEEAAAG